MSKTSYEERPDKKKSSKKTKKKEFQSPDVTGQFMEELELLQQQRDEREEKKIIAKLEAADNEAQQTTTRTRSHTLGKLFTKKPRSTEVELQETKAERDHYKQAYEQLLALAKKEQQERSHYQTQTGLFKDEYGKLTQQVKDSQQQLGILRDSSKLAKQLKQTQDALQEANDTIVAQQEAFEAEVAALQQRHEAEIHSLSDELELAKTPPPSSLPFLPGEREKLQERVEQQQEEIAHLRSQLQDKIPVLPKPPSKYPSSPAPEIPAKPSAESRAKFKKKEGSFQERVQQGDTTTICFPGVGSHSSHAQHALASKGSGFGNSKGSSD